MRLLLLITLLAPWAANAQLQLGWRTDTYAGINSALVNPALPGRTAYAWDVNLGEAAFFVANNYAFLKNSSAARLIRERDSDATFLFQRNIPADIERQTGVFVYDYLERSDYFAHTLASVLGPSFSVQVAPATRIGLFTRWQTRVDATGLDGDFGFYQWEQLPEVQPINVDRANLAVANWSEVGLNISQGIVTGSGDLLVGLTVRRLWGHRGGYLSSNRAFDIRKLPGSIGLDGSDFEMEGAFTNNIIDDGDPAATPGSGWAGDIGMVYRVDLGDDYYRWEFGVAVLDVGRLQFREGERHLFTRTTLTTVLNSDYESLELDSGPETVAQQFSQDVFGDASVSRTADAFTMGLPTTLSLQATYRLADWAKVEANYLLGVQSSVGMRRTSLLAVTPRVERHWWGVAMPISLYAAEQLRLGMAVRLGPLFIGTDQLGTLLRKQQLTGADLYMGVKLHPWNLRGDKGGSRRGKAKARRRGGKPVECYKF